MYSIIKVLNNNTILTAMENTNYIFLGKGIGFGKKVGDSFAPREEDQKYVFVTKDEKRNHPNTAFNNVDPIFVEIVLDIMNIIKEEYQFVDEDVLVPLVDHIAFAIERLNNNIKIENPFIKDIALLFPKEYEVAQKARLMIEKRVHCQLPEDEVGYITLHIRSSISSNRVDESIQVMEVIRQNILKLQNDLHITINENSIAYIRLMNHLKFLLLRLDTNEDLNMDISEFTKTNYPFAYKQATKICRELTKVLAKEVPEVEIGYLALHLERILSQELANAN